MTASHPRALPKEEESLPLLCTRHVNTAVFLSSCELQPMKYLLSFAN
jgi:hypothetical protein